jgi:lipid A 4'-phosphatase
MAISLLSIDKKHVLFVIISILVGILFYKHPELDLEVSKLFYDEARGGFYLKDFWLVKMFQRMVPLIVMSFTVFVVVATLRKVWLTKSLDPRNYIKIVYLALVCIIGPGLIVNSGFKQNFGRARPSQVVEFGGESQFTPAFVISKQCNDNCSFISGHASIGFFFMALAFIMPYYTRYLLLGIAMGAVFGACRIIQGAHFLSDVIFSGVFVYLTAYFVAKVIKPKERGEKWDVSLQ